MFPWITYSQLTLEAVQGTSLTARKACRSLYFFQEKNHKFIEGSEVFHTNIKESNLWQSTNGHICFSFNFGSKSAKLHLIESRHEFGSSLAKCLEIGLGLSLSLIVKFEHSCLQALIAGVVKIVIIISSFFIPLLLYAESCFRVA